LSDIRYLTGISDEEARGDGMGLSEMSAATRQYVDRLRALTDPHLVLSHAYTRYLGDLSGGQILARAVSKAFDVQGPDGVAFYRFDQVGSSPTELKAFKRKYRATLDGLRISRAQADKMVQEANLAFLLNISIFQERDVAAGHLSDIKTIDELGKMVKSSKSPLCFQTAYNAPRQSSPQCPFFAQAGSEVEDQVCL